MFKPWALILLVCVGIASARADEDGQSKDRPNEERVEAAIAVGNVGAGLNAGYTNQGRFHYLNAELGMLTGGPGNLRALGSAGAMVIQPKGGLALGDPMALHSNGVYSQVGFSPALLLGGGIDNNNTIFHIEPKVMQLHDSARNIEAVGLGGQVMVARDISPELRLSLLGQLIATDAGQANGAFYMGKMATAYKISPNVAIAGSMEISDLVLSKDVQQMHVPESKPAALGTFGIQGVF
jgi:hypothetical protein